MKCIKICLPILSVVLASASCSSRHDDAHDAHDSHDDSHEELGPDDVHFPDAQALSVGLRVDTLAPDSSFAPVIACGGVIEAQAAGSATVVASQSGIVNIVDTRLAPGAFLAKGQAVATISGKSVQDGDAALKAKLEYEAARKDYDRASLLVADNIISQKEYEDAKLRCETARSAYDATAARMTASGVAVTSPVAGHVVRVLAVQGQYVSAGQTLAVVERCGSKRLRADVPERHYAELRNVVSANFSTSASDSVLRIADMGGRLVSVGVSVAEGSSYVPVTFDFADPDELFLAGSAARVFLVLRGSASGGALTVPCSAIVESQGLKFVYLRDADDADVYHRREVTLGQSDGLRTEVVRGLSAGDIVVSAGARRLHLAGSSKTIPAHTHNH